MPPQRPASTRWPCPGLEVAAWTDPDRIHTTFTPRSHHVHTTFTPCSHRAHIAFTRRVVRDILAQDLSIAPPATLVHPHLRTTFIPCLYRIHTLITPCSPLPPPPAQQLVRDILAQDLGIAPPATLVHPHLRTTFTPHSHRAHTAFTHPRQARQLIRDILAQDLGITPTAEGCAALRRRVAAMTTSALQVGG
jgi:hypothetical protein